MLDSECTYTESDNFKIDRKRYLKRNYAATVADGTFWGCGLAFVQPESTLPGIAGSMGAPDWFLALLPMSLIMGYYVTPLFTVHHVQKLRHMMPFAFFYGFIQRTFFLFAAIILYFFGDAYPSISLASLFIAPFLCGVFGGVGMSAWVGMVSRCLPEKYRASNMALRALLGALLGIGTGEVVKCVLHAYPNSTGYAILHLLAFLFLMCSVAALRMTKEPIPPKSDEIDTEAESTGFITTVKLVPPLMVKDLRLRYAVLSNFTGHGHYIYIPFLAVYAMKVTQSGESFLGFLIQGQMVGMIIGNILAMLWGHRIGCFRLMFITRTLFFLVAASVFLPLGEWGYFSAFVCYGIAYAGNSVLNTILPMEVAPLSRVPLYASLLFTLNLPALIFAWGVGSSSTFFGGGIYFPAAVGGVMLFFSACFSLLLQRMGKLPESI
jgi:hypothetical protein